MCTRLEPNPRRRLWRFRHCSLSLIVGNSSIGCRTVQSLLQMMTVVVVVVVWSRDRRGDNRSTLLWHLHVEFYTGSTTTKTRNMSASRCLLSLINLLCSSWVTTDESEWLGRPPRPPRFCWDGGRSLRPRAKRERKRKKERQDQIFLGAVMVKR